MSTHHYCRHGKSYWQQCQKCSVEDNEDRYKKEKSFYGPCDTCVYKYSLYTCSRCVHKVNKFKEIKRNR